MASEPSGASELGRKLGARVGESLGKTALNLARASYDEGYERGVRDTLARLTEPEVRDVALAAWDREARSGASGIAQMDAALAAVAAALAPREETEA